MRMSLWTPRPLRGAHRWILRSQCHWSQCQGWPDPVQLQKLRASHGSVLISQALLSELLVSIKAGMILGEVIILQMWSQKK